MESTLKTRLERRPARLVTALEASGPRGLPTAAAIVLLGTSKRTAYRSLRALEARGKIERPQRGTIRYTARHPAPPPLVNETGRKIWKIMEHEHLPGYVSGLDVIGGSAHQLLVAFPHLVVVETGRRDESDFALARGGFDIRSASQAQPILANPDRVVLLQEARDWLNPPYQVRGHVAPPEVAWLDLYLLTRKGLFPMAGAELGRILQDLLGDSRFAHRLRVLARRRPSSDLLSLLDGAEVNGFPAQVAAGLWG